MLFASDVDSTLVYPARTQPASQPTETAEVRDGRILTCASVDLTPALRELAACGVTLVPVTTRSRAQLEAVTHVRGTRLAITASGADVWQDGAALPGWAAHLRRLLDGAADAHQARRHLARGIASAPWVIGEDFIDGYFFFLLAPHGQLPADAEHDAREELTGLGWTAYAHGRKLYCMPQQLRKESAVAWLIDRSGDALLAAAGDSELDAGLLAMAPAAFCPRDSSLAASPLRPAHARITEAARAAAGPEIVRAVARLSRRPPTPGTGTAVPAWEAGVERLAAEPP